MIAAKEDGVPTNQVSQSKGTAQAQTSIDRVVAALIAQIFTASDRSGSRQSKNRDNDSSSERNRNTATSASAYAATSISSNESQNGFCPGVFCRVSCMGLVYKLHSSALSLP